MDNPELIAATALPPYDTSTAAFRTAVYTYPGIARIRIPASQFDAEHDVSVSELAPGTCLIVRGSEDSNWTVLLTRHENGRFTVTRPPAAPPEPGGTAILAV